MWFISEEIDGYYAGSKTVIKSNEPDSMMENRFIAKTTNQTRYGWKSIKQAEKDAKDIIELLSQKETIKELLKQREELTNEVLKLRWENAAMKIKNKELK